MQWRFDRPIIMGVLNVTPDSFSDGGRFLDRHQAIDRARQMLSEGADVIDIGGESTRPGAPRIDEPEQIARTAPVVQAVRELIDRPGNTHAMISIDTTRSAVAQAALDAGATIINDVSAGGDDPAMWPLAARHDAGLILMHMQGQPATMQVNPTYEDVVAEVKAFLLQRAQAAVAAGVMPQRIVIDPGIGFGKTLEHNLALLRNLNALTATRYPVLLGASRKRFARTICNVADDDEQRRHMVGATCATTALGVAAGVKLFRVHDVRPNRQAADLAHAIQNTPAHR